MNWDLETSKPGLEISGNIMNEILELGKGTHVKRVHVYTMYEIMISDKNER